MQIVRAIKYGEHVWPNNLRVKTEGSDKPKQLKATIAAASFDQEKGILFYQGRI